jgi:glycerol kinase
LTGGKAHATDATNASRTLLLNLRKLSWDPEILKLLKIPAALLPEVHPSSCEFGKTASLGTLKSGIPIHALVGDQQGALYGQGCYQKGEMKNTYGTGCFLMINQGKTYQEPPAGVLGTLACDAKGRPAYALEGAIFIAGAAIQWLRDGLGLIRKAKETEKLARQVKDTAGVVLIPAFTGLGSPYWEPNARGAIFGLTRGTTKAHIVRAALESIAFQTADVFELMTRTVGRKPRYLKADGGAAANPYLMQFQADLLGTPILRTDRTESTAWGAAKLAGIGVGFWKEVERIDRERRYKRFSPKMHSNERIEKIKSWRSCVQRLLAKNI